MKLFSTYIKEMKIAFRGYYVYIEIFMAILVLTILLVTVKENPDGKSKEYLYNNIPDQFAELHYEEEVAKGRIRFIDDTELTIKPGTFSILNKDTGEKQFFEFSDEKKVMAKTYQKLNAETGAVVGTAYVLDNEEDMLRLSNSNGHIGATTTMDAAGELSYKYYLQGFETERFSEVLYLLHTYSIDELLSVKDSQTTRELGSSGRLNNREAVVPLFIAFSGALMSFFIIMSYVFLDKSQGVIKAFAVTPSSVLKYLISKIFVILTITILSSSIIIFPIMKLKPNYLLVFIFLIASTYLFSSLGLLVGSFFDTMSKAFGVLYIMMIAMMLPAFSYYISSFDPVWIRFLPTYSILEGFKGIMKGQPDMSYILTYTLVFIVGGSVLLLFANYRFKKSLTV